MVVALLFGSFALLLILRVPIGISLGMSSLITIFASGVVQPTYLAQGLVTGADSFSLMAVPFFVLAGELMATGGISRRLLNIADAFLGRKYGGLALVTVVACMFFAAISGSGPATVAAIGGLTIPSMFKQGYDKPFAGAISAAAGSIGVIIPPSIPMVMYCVATGVSVGAMFMGGVIPGILIGISLCVYSSLYSKKHKYINAEAAPFSWGNVGRSLVDGIWALLVPVIILGGIYGGIFTPPEAAAVAVAYGLIVGLFVYRDLKAKDLYRIFGSAALTTATIMVILGTATTFGRILTLERIPTMIADFFESVAKGPIMLLILINILLLIVGCFMETNAAIIILAPIFLPIVESMGINPVHFGIVMVVNLAIGFVTPPLGVNLFVSCNVANAKLEEICKGILPILGVMILDLLLITYIEPLSMFLPALLGY
ncbi:MAG: TRAP transporter large permease [Dysosmobacter sp.]|uniref:TRAP transporter large permease n=1 Tax=Dysosmobacter sp. TaxID=2591382 RepID=UPI00284B8971|nr:TRAP transporter large permease [Dysosmobacter sp.]MDR3983604.1 TRAP transporter large permease [Dysosmobacter sp.]